MTADRENHSRQRRLLAHAFSEKALREQEGVLVKYCTRLLNQLEARCREGPVDLTEWFHLTSKLDQIFRPPENYTDDMKHLTLSAPLLLEKTSHASTLESHTLLSPPSKLYPKS